MLVLVSLPSINSHGHGKNDGQICPVCIISCNNKLHVSLVIRKWFSNSPDKELLLRSTHLHDLTSSATAARSITLTLLSRMVQLIVSESSCYKAAKMFKKFAIFETQQRPPSMPCVAEHMSSNCGTRSDAFHSTSENSENLNQWFLLKVTKHVLQGVPCTNLGTLKVNKIMEDTMICGRDRTWWHHGNLRLPGISRPLICLVLKILFSFLSETWMLSRVIIK